MRYVVMALFIAMVSCNNSATRSASPLDSNQKRKDNTNTDAVPDAVDSANLPVADPGHKTYGNARFRNVTIQQTGDSSFRIRGEAQIFEASFGWVVEDGHNEIKQGFVTASMGAPEWGTFNFGVEVKKPRPNATLHIILFETSMKDGSRQHELPLVLY